MPPRSESAFAELFRGLSPTRRRQFVEAVWEARGWEIASAEDDLVARKAGVTRRIRVVHPRWIGTPDLGDADVVVATRDGESLRAAAEAAGIECVSPADLRSMLLYGVERPEGARLFETVFDRPLSVPRAEPASSTFPTGGLSRLSLPKPPATAVLVVVLVVLAGLSVADPSLLSPSREPKTSGVGVERTYTPGTTGALGGDGVSSGPDLPPGLSEAGVENASVLADAHHSATANRRYAFSFDFAGPAAAPDFGEWTVVEWELVVEHRRAFSVEASFNGTDRWRSVRIYADGSRDYRIYATPENVRTTEAPVGASDASTYAHFASGLVERYLDTTDSSVTCEAAEAGSCRLYRVNVSGEAPALSDRLTGNATIRDYRAVAHVRPDGFVSELVVRYDLVADGSPETVDLRVSYDDYGTARIEKPAWLSRFDDAGSDGRGTTPAGTESASTAEHATSTATAEA